MIEIIFHFLFWTLILYWIHRLSHRVPIIKKIHAGHHKFISKSVKQNSGPINWNWNNLFLFNDNWISTADLWITEVIPSLIYSWITGQWWIIIFYYCWAAFVQERIEHNPRFDIYPLLTSGKSHLVHHNDVRKNFGLFTPLWDKIFGTFASHSISGR